MPCSLNHRTAHIVHYSLTRIPMMPGVTILVYVEIATRILESDDIYHQTLMGFCVLWQRDQPPNCQMSALCLIFTQISQPLSDLRIWDVSLLLTLAGPMIVCVNIRHHF